MTLFFQSANQKYFPNLCVVNQSKTLLKRINKIEKLKHRQKQVRLKDEDQQMTKRILNSNLECEMGSSEHSSDVKKRLITYDSSFHDIYIEKCLTKNIKLELFNKKIENFKDLNFDCESIL